MAHESFGSFVLYQPGPYWQVDAWPTTHAEYTLPKGELCDDFHVYGMLWDANGIVTYIDSPDQVRIIT